MPSNQWLRRLTDTMELEGEADAGVSVVELAGDRRLLIERHRGVTAYSRETIGVRMPFGAVCIHGCDLELSSMCAGQLVIRGRINAIEIIRRSP